ncbi:hypothetical protein DFQ27_006681 [Actinomortierella ambigua]|uniref:Uncharacterized protein n=1 Tax=Actinomortierella ambigua TaxID=1343610 RepID=A0A9P6QJ50_9FUNG|nr:hypothetical protein DFQ27_006681 [Actinomortierella ambigua]
MFTFRQSESGQQLKDAPTTAATTTTIVEPTVSSGPKPDDKPLSKTEQLQEIENTEKDMTSSLQKQLEHARETSARLNNASNGGGNSNTSNKANNNNSNNASTSASAAAAAVVSLSAAESTNDVSELRRALQEANERIKQQKTQIKKLQHEVDVERGHATILRHDNQVLRQKNVNLHAVAEQEEENISNRLLKRISGLKKEKGELMLQVEQEEEYLTQTLQKKLQQLQKEKIDMENALEQEQEYIVNRLQKQLEALRLEQSGGASAASSWHDKDFGLIGSSPINIAGGGRPHSMTFPNPSPTPSPTQKKWIPGHSPSSSSDHGPSHPMFDMVRAELVATKSTLNELEREYMVKFRQCNRLKSEVLALRQELGLPVGSDLTMEESLPTILSSSIRGVSSNTPSRRNSRNSVTGLPRGGGGSISGVAGAGGLFSSSSSSYGVVPATPSNTPANPAPISSHHFAAHRPTLVPQHLSSSSQALQPHDPLATSPILGAFPGAPLGHERGGGGGGGNAGGPGSHHHPPPPPPSHQHHHGSSAVTSGTNSMASSVGSLGSTSPLMSSSYSSTSSTALPSIVPERQSLYRSKSGSSRQLGHYPNFMNSSPQTTPYHHQTYHSHHHAPYHHHGYPTTAAAAAAAASQQYHHHRQSWSSSSASNSHPHLPMGHQSANTSSSSVSSATQQPQQQQQQRQQQQQSAPQQLSPSTPPQHAQSEQQQLSGAPTPTPAEAHPTAKAEVAA